MNLQCLFCPCFFLSPLWTLFDGCILSITVFPFFFGLQISFQSLDKIIVTCSASCLEKTRCIYCASIDVVACSPISEHLLDFCCMENLLTSGCCWTSFLPTGRYARSIRDREGDVTSSETRGGHGCSHVIHPEMSQ